MKNISQLSLKNKYETLINILDELRNEAPIKFKRYYPAINEDEKINHARSLAFIHLYLKVKFGLIKFKDREDCICDGAYDGGIDAYYINTDKKVIYFIQSKFRTNSKNFCSKEIGLNEILAMEVDRITEGETTDENNNEYNSKVLKLVNKIQKIDDIARYKYEIIILANLNNVTPNKLKKLTGGLPAKVFDFNKCYGELVFPVVSGTYYDKSDLFINISLPNKDFMQSRINYPVSTKYTECEITLLFVSTLELAKILYKYKNSILKYNPRSYLDISNNPVNKEISKTIKEMDTNEFSLFNNGITMLSDETSLNEKIGKKGLGQLHIKNPQIINGGQTAYTLSKIYADNLKQGYPNNVFDNKEVMLKIITFTDINENSNNDILTLIENISRATNQQTAVDDADRRSNDKIQIELQKRIFEEFGYFYERKRGEFYDGLNNHYIDKSKIIDRSLFLRICYAISDKPSQARRNSDKVLFKKDSFDQILNDVSKTNIFVFGYLCYKNLETIQKKFSRSSNRYGLINYGHGLRYGKMAIINAITYILDEEITKKNIEEFANKYINLVLPLWTAFESFIMQQEYNKDYFNSYLDDNGNEMFEINYNGYYKGRNVNKDVKSFFKQFERATLEESAVTKENIDLYEL